MKSVIYIINDLRATHLLDNVINELFVKFNLTVVLGAEIEFYLYENNADILSSNFNYKFQKEKGQSQFEVNFNPTSDIFSLIAEIDDLKLKMRNLIPNKDPFHPKPYIGDYGSALHIHINFAQLDWQSNECAPTIEFISSILCHYMEETFLIFAPAEESYNRFNKRFMAPTNISFGGNNRTAAIRVPDSRPKRIEHRVAGSDSDVYAVILTILLSIYKGLSNPEVVKIYDKIYGNCFDDYGLTPLPQSVNQAKNLFNQKFFL